MSLVAILFIPAEDTDMDDPKNGPVKAIIMVGKALILQVGIMIVLLFLNLLRAH